MIFSANLFLYVFLVPVVLANLLLLRFAGGRTGPANLVLLLFSVGLYYWGNGSAVVPFLGTIVITYLIARVLSDAAAPVAGPLLALGIVANLAILIYYKYFAFLADQLLGPSAARALIALAPGGVDSLPIGISFYTFMAISYLVEVRRGVVPPTSLFRFATYLTMFPHLVAGPIVRFSEIQDQVRRRRVDTDRLFEGLWRFAIGLGKKVLIATPLGEAADAVFRLPPDQLSAPVAWFGIACYTFQIFYDFSGYTDMAIGLARMIGFSFPENFDRPYRAPNITAFWRRWHMTLTRWFRDYLYFSLGGNRAGLPRTLVNLWLVFFLCGLWHGAAWTFVVWGLYHGALLVIERVAAKSLGFRPSGLAGAALTFVLVMIGWVFFRAETLAGALGYLAALFGGGAAATSSLDTAALFKDSTLACLAAAAIFAWVPFERLGERMPGVAAAGAAGRGLAILTLLVLSAAFLSGATYNPFIYFRF